MQFTESIYECEKDERDLNSSTHNLKVSNKNGTFQPGSRDWGAKEHGSREVSAQPSLHLATSLKKAVPPANGVVQAGEGTLNRACPLPSHPWTPAVVPSLLADC